MLSIKSSCKRKSIVLIFLLGFCATSNAIEEVIVYGVSDTANDFDFWWDTNISPTVFRPPNGSIDERDLDYLDLQEFLDDCRDSADDVYNQCISQYTTLTTGTCVMVSGIAGRYTGMSVRKFTLGSSGAADAVDSLIAGVGALVWSCYDALMAPATEFCEEGKDRMVDTCMANY